MSARTWKDGSTGWYAPITDDDREWMRRYPGSFAGPLSKHRTCWLCGRDGYTVPAPPPPITVLDFDAPLGAPKLRTGDTCPGHEYATRRFLYEHPEFYSLTDTLKGWRWG